MTTTYQFSYSQDGTYGRAMGLLREFAGKEGVVYLLDASDLGGGPPTHSTPFYQSPQIANDQSLGGNTLAGPGQGVWGSMATYETADGKRYLVIHGDEFDSVVRYARFLALLGDWAYTLALIINRWFNAVRRRLGYPYWSLSAWLKRQVKEAVKAIDRFETALADDAKHRGFDGVVCGHIHHAEMRTVNGVLYLNDGDWVESCTALVEHADGKLELVDWVARNKLSLLPASAARVSASKEAVLQSVAAEIGSARAVSARA